MRCSNIFFLLRNRRLSAISNTFNSYIVNKQLQISPSAANSWNTVTLSTPVCCGGARFVASSVPQSAITPIEQAIFRANTVEDFVNIATQYSLSVHQAASFFVHLCRVSENLFDSRSETQRLDIRKDDRFRGVYQVVQKYYQLLRPHDVIILLRSLLYLGCDPHTDQTVKDLELEVAYIMGRETSSKLTVPISALVSFTCFHCEYQNSASPVVFQTQRLLEESCLKRIDEMHVKDFLLFYNKIGSRKANDVLKLMEKHALERGLIDQMSMDELVNMLNYLAEKSSRNVPLLKTICERLSAVQQSTMLSVKRIAFILSAVNKLSFYSDRLIQVISNDLSAQLANEHKPAMISHLLLQYGQGRIRHAEVLNALADRISVHFDECRPQDLVIVVNTLARVNNYTGANEALLKRIASQLTRARIGNDQAFLHAVWSLAVSQQLTAPLATEVLCESFYAPLIISSNPMAAINKVRLLNIDAAAFLELPSFAGPLLKNVRESISLQDQEDAMKYKEELVGDVLKALRMQFSEEQCICQPQITDDGHLIDAEVLVDAEGNGVTRNAENLKQYKRVALLVFDFHDYTRHMSRLTGENAMAARHLTARGYTVVKVPYFVEEVRQQNRKRDLPALAAYLKQQITNSVKRSLTKQLLDKK